MCDIHLNTFILFDHMNAFFGFGLYDYKKRIETADETQDFDSDDYGGELDIAMQ